MGSFFSSCSISHMRLLNQKTSIQLLVPNSTNLSGHKSMIVTNEGSQAFYSPFAFPIHGTYDDYGYLQDIKEDNNTKMLEEFFNMNIYDIIKHIGRESDVPEDIKNEDIYNSLSMTYFRTEVLEHLQEGWENIDLENPEKYTSDESLKKFFDSYFKEKSTDRLDYLESLESMTHDEKMEYMDIIRSSYTKPRNYISSYTMNMFNILPIDISFKEQILKQHQFLVIYGWGLGRVLLPSVYGSQQDNYTRLYNLNELVNDLLVEDISHNEYYDEDEDREANSILKRHQRNKNLRDIGI